MLADGQVSHFKSFGFLFLPNLFSGYEMARITTAADDLWSTLRNGAPLDLDAGQSSGGGFVERDDVLTKIVKNDRIYASVESILGPGFLWAGSEGNVTVRSEHPWRPDRPGDDDEISATRLKVNVYLDPITEENGCLRVIPGSHRLPLHEEIEPERRHQGLNENVTPFDVPGPAMPSVSLESSPGDVIFFHQSIWHSIFNGWAGRRYIALKFVAKPETDNHLASLRYHASDMFDPHPNWRDSGNRKIQSMVSGLPELGAKKVHDFVPFRDDHPKIT